MGFKEGFKEIARSLTAKGRAENKEKKRVAAEAIDEREKNLDTAVAGAFDFLQITPLDVSNLIFRPDPNTKDIIITPPSSKIAEELERIGKTLPPADRQQYLDMVCKKVISTDLPELPNSKVHYDPSTRVLTVMRNLKSEQ